MKNFNTICIFTLTPNTRWLIRLFVIDIALSLPILFIIPSIFLQLIPGMAVPWNVVFEILCHGGQLFLDASGGFLPAPHPRAPSSGQSESSFPAFLLHWLGWATISVHWGIIDDTALNGCGPRNRIVCLRYCDLSGLCALLSLRVRIVTTAGSSFLKPFSYIVFYTDICLTVSVYVLLALCF